MGATVSLSGAKGRGMNGGGRATLQRMAPLSILLPSLVLAAAAALMWRSPSHLAPVRSKLPLGAGLAASAFALALLRLVWDGPMELVVSPWTLATFDVAPGVMADRLAAAVMLAIALGVVAVGLREATTPDEDASEARRHITAGGLLVASAALFFISGTCSPLGLVMGWMALDGALFLVGGQRRRALIAGQAGLMLALAGLATLPAATNSLCGEPLEAFPSLTRQLLLVAAMIRMGLYPIWWSVPRTPDERPWWGGAIRLAPILAGIHLALRLGTGFDPEEGLSTMTLLPAFLGIVMGTGLTWLARERIEALDWLTTMQAGLILVAISLGGPVGQGIALVLAAELVLLSLAWWPLVRLESSTRASAAIRWATAASLAGFPPTLGFAGRWLLYQELVTRQVRAGLLLAVASTMLAAVWTMQRDPSVHRIDRKERGLVPLALLAALMLATGGLMFGVWQAVAQALVGAPLYSPLPVLAQAPSDLLRAGVSTETVGNVAVALAVVLPFALAALTWWYPLTARIEHEPGRRRLRRLLRLDTLSQKAVSRLVTGGELLQGQPARSGRTLALTTLAIVAVSMMALAGQVPPAAAPNTPAMSTLAHLFLAVVVLTGATILLSSAPWLTLAALFSGFGLASALLALADDFQAFSVFLAMIKLLVGTLVVAMLAISVLDRPGPRFGVAARRLREMRGTPTLATEGTLRLVALVVLVAIVYGLPIPQNPDFLASRWPAAVLRPALALVAGGALTAIFAETPLRLVAGVLLALAGFDVLYTRLEPSLAMTGGLAVFQLLFALVASNWVTATAPAAESTDRTLEAPGAAPPRLPSVIRRRHAG